jgi:hypothetical protein
VAARGTGRAPAAAAGAAGSPGASGDVNGGDANGDGANSGGEGGGGEDGNAGDADDAGSAPVLGAGRQAAVGFARKQRKKRTRLFMSSWLEQHDWLETCPKRSKDEWDERPDEDPQYVTCAACHMFPRTAHKDVIFKHPSGNKTLRKDKLTAHADNIAHNRAVTQWRARMKEVVPAPAPASTEAVPVDRATVALHSLVRTIMTTVVNKCSISLVSKLVKLQVTTEDVNRGEGCEAGGVKQRVLACRLPTRRSSQQAMRVGRMVCRPSSMRRCYCCRGSRTSGCGLRACSPTWGTAAPIGK